MSQGIFEGQVLTPLLSQHQEVINMIEDLLLMLLRDIFKAITLSLPSH